MAVILKNDLAQDLRISGAPLPQNGNQAVQLPNFLIGHRGSGHGTRRQQGGARERRGARPGCRGGPPAGSAGCEGGDWRRAGQSGPGAGCRARAGCVLRPARCDLGSRLSPRRRNRPEARRLAQPGTNAIEALNSKLRRAVRARGHFPSDEAATKLLFLVLNRSEKEWIMPPREWAMAQSQFAVLFGERFTSAMA